MEKIPSVKLVEEEGIFLKKRHYIYIYMYTTQGEEGKGGGVSNIHISYIKERERTISFSFFFHSMVGNTTIAKRNLAPLEANERGTIERKKSTSISPLLHALTDWHMLAY